MPVVYNDATESYEIFDVVHCEQPMDDVGCDAPGCAGFGFVCRDCGFGCDLDVDADGNCARARAAESQQDFADRVDRERAAFGLKPLQGD